MYCTCKCYHYSTLNTNDCSTSAQLVVAHNRGTVYSHNVVFYCSNKALKRFKDPNLRYVRRF